MQKIKIRPAKEADLPIIYELSRNLCNYKKNTYDLPDIVAPDWMETTKGQQYMHHMMDKQFLWVAVVDDKPIGYCMGNIINSCLNTCSVAQVLDIFITDEYRYSGVGGMLINTFKEFCRKRGCFRLKVSFVEQNKVAEAFYEKHGFGAYEKIYFCEI